MMSFDLGAWIPAWILDLCSKIEDDESEGSIDAQYHRPYEETVFSSTTGGSTCHFR